MNIYQRFIRTQCYTIPQVAKLLNVSDQTVRRWIKTGHLKTVRLGGPESHHRVPMDVVQAAMKGAQTGSVKTE